MEPEFKPTEMGQILFRLLQQMDSEATTMSYWGGYLYPTGLRNFDQHLRPNLDASPTSKPRLPSEDCVRDEIIRRLITVPGIVAIKGCPRYPNGGEIGDMLIEGQASKIWLEMKCLKTYNVDRLSCSPNRSFRKHLMNDNESVAKDFRKLVSIIRPIATHVAVLAIGFDIAHSSSLCISDALIESMKIRARYHDYRWTEEPPIEWPDVHQPNDPQTNIRHEFRVRCWYWWREVAL